MCPRTTLHRLAGACLLLLPALLAAMGPLPPPFDLRSLIEDQHSIMLLSDTGEYTRHVPYARVCLRQRYTPADFATRLEAQDSLVTAHVETCYDPDLRQTEFSLHTADAGVQLTSYDWAQRRDMAGLRAGGDALWRGGKVEAAAAAQYWSAFHHTQARARLRYLFPRVALDVTAHMAHNPDIRWLAGAEALLPWHSLVLSAGARVNDAGTVFGSARVQAVLRRNLLLQAGTVPMLDTPPLAGLFADSLLSFAMRQPTDDALDAWVSRTCFLVGEVALGDWKALARWDGSYGGHIRQTVWNGADWQWQRYARNGGEHTLAGELRLRRIQMNCSVHPGERRELDYRLRAGAGTRLRLLPYTYLSLNGGYTDRLLLQGQAHSYLSTGAGITWTGALHWEGGLRLENDWRHTVPGEQDRRLRIGAYICYRQGDNG